MKNTIERDKILEVRSGSWLYGLNLPQSDMDYQGIFMPSEKNIFGLQEIREVDLSIKDKLSNGKNSKDAIDRKFYEFRRYVRLAMDNNPNILELIFANEDNIVFINHIGRELLNNAHLFPYAGCIDRFCGYAKSQKNKMIIKKDNFIELEEAETFLSTVIDDGGGDLLLPQLEKYSDFYKLFKIKNQTDMHYRIGNRSVGKNQTVKRCLSEVQRIIGNSTNRKELIKDKGYDYKFAHHLIRLLLEGKELLETGALKFPLANKDELLDIKQGNWSLNAILDYSSKLEDDIKLIKTVLPKKPRYNEIENFTIDVLRRWVSYENRG